MTATLTIGEAGQICLPESLRHVFDAKPGVPLRAEVTEGRIVIVKEDVPVVTETMRTASGRLVLARTGNDMDVAKAVREERDALADRADLLVQPETLAAASCHDIAHDLAGSLKKLPKDVATNPQYMENFGQ